jgi:hypothetical protein
MKSILKFTSFVFVLATLISACSNEKSSVAELSDLNWMLGAWENSFEDGSMIEEWTSVNDSLYTGRGYMIADDEEIPSEDLQLELRADGIYYIATPITQSRTEFKLTSSENGKATFENPEHDFPQKIEYAMMGRDSLYAKVSGKVGDTEKAFELFFARKK